MSEVMENLENTLNEIRATLLTGEISRLDELSRKQEDKLSRLLERDHDVDASWLERLRTKASHNQRLIAAARNGLLDARRILFDPAPQTPSLRTYGPAGKTTDLSEFRTAVQRKS